MLLHSRIDLTGRTLKMEPGTKSYGRFREMRTLMAGGSYLYRHFIDSNLLITDRADKFNVKSNQILELAIKTIIDRTNPNTTPNKITKKT